MLIGVVSDTHGHARNTLDAIRMLESLQVEQVLHCGDIGLPELVRLFSAWPTHFVFGNVDDPREMRAAIHAARQTCHERFGDFTLGETRIALLHGDDGQRLTQSINGGQYGLVCHGHTHVPRQEWVRDTLVLNPGALYRADRHTIAVIELPSRQVTQVAV